MENLTATIELYQPKHDHLKTKTKHRGVKPFVYVVRIGGMIIIKPSEISADKWLYRNGFRLSEDCTHYVQTHKSDDHVFLEHNYIKM
jgi:hypothetical protein